MLKTILLLSSLFASSAMADVLLTDGESVWANGELLVCGDNLYIGDVVYESGERIECIHEYNHRRNHGRGYRCEIRTNQSPYITGIGYGYDQREAVDDALADCREQAPTGSTICFNKVPRCHKR